jgi:serine phosphatase RsbU (regulator of sigma subunit)/tetratricopeptide (TPR) repeat protein
MKQGFKYTIFLIYCLSSLCYTYAQNSKIDSLLTLIKTDKEDINKVEHLNKLPKEYERIGEYYKGLNYCNDALALSQKLNYGKGIANSHNIIGDIYNYQGNYPKALKNYFSALEIYEKIKDENGIAYSYNNIGVVFNYQSNYSEALKKHLAALKIRIEIKDKQSVAQSYNNMGNVYLNQGNYSESLKMYKASLKTCEEIKFKVGIAHSYGNIGIIYAIQDDLPKALKSFLISIKMQREIGDNGGVANSFINLGELYIRLHKRKEAEAYLDSALCLATTMGNTNTIKESYSSLTRLDSASGNFKTAYEHYKLYMIYRDSLYNKETEKKSIQTSMQYEFEKKELAAKAQQEELAVINSEEKQKQLLVIYTVTGVLILVVLFSIVLYNRFKINEKQKIKIEQQKIQLEISHKKVSDSINYAQKIQYSILPSEEDIKKHILNHFAYFNPKDTIGGDFYWFYHYNGFSYIAVADCTGHGVPGALVSMIIYSLLDEIMMEEKLTNPGEILSRLHNHVYKTLQQQKGDEYSQDGCDISLGVFDHTNKLLHFAGARNSAYLTNGKNIIVLKATAKSIGGLSILGEPEPERTYKSETIELKEEMLLVMSTDGIFDQLNNQDEAFGNTRFKEMIYNVYNQSIIRGSEIISSSINSWKKNTQSQDDMLVMGFQLTSNMI